MVGEPAPAIRTMAHTPPCACGQTSTGIEQRAARALTSGLLALNDGRAGAIVGCAGHHPYVCNGCRAADPSAGRAWVGNRTTRAIQAPSSRHGSLKMCIAATVHACLSRRLCVRGLLGRREHVWGAPFTHVTVFIKNDAVCTPLFALDHKYRGRLWTNRTPEHQPMRLKSGSCRQAAPNLSI